MNNSLLEIKSLFEKIHTAYVWALTHPQDDNRDLWENKVLPTVDRYYKRLEELGVPLEFSMCLFCFGIDYVIAYKSWST